MDAVWKFIRKKSAATELSNQLHAILYCSICFRKSIQLSHDRYCLPMDGSSRLLTAHKELEFFDKGTGKGNQ